MSLSNKSLELSLAETDRTLENLRKRKKLSRKQLLSDPKRAPAIALKQKMATPALKLTNPLLRRVRGMVWRRGVSVADLTKIEVEKGVILELAAQSVGDSPMSKEAARELFRRDRSMTATMGSVDPRLQKKAREVVKLAHMEANREEAEEKSRAKVFSKGTRLGA